MKNINLFQKIFMRGLVVLFTMLICNPLFAQESTLIDVNKKINNMQNKIDSLNEKIINTVDDTSSLVNKFKKLENAVSEIRRDQLNYKIEKDLLKETFSSNYQTINIVLTIILGIFTLIAVFGFRDIGRIRKDYLDELKELSELRKDFELRIKEFESGQEKVKDDYIEILKANEEQNRRIKILELQEKISSLIESRNYRGVLEYAAVALHFDPDNVIILYSKALALWRTGDLHGAVLAYEKVVDIEPNNVKAVLELHELYLIQNQIEKYEILYKEHKSIVDRECDGNINIYFKALKLYQQNDYNSMKLNVQKYVATVPPEKNTLAEWEFNDVLVAFKSHPDSKKKRLLLLFIELLMGKIDKEEANNRIIDIDK